MAPVTGTITKVHTVSQVLFGDELAVVTAEGVEYSLRATAAGTLDGFAVQVQLSFVFLAPSVP